MTWVSARAWAGFTPWDTRVSYSAWTGLPGMARTRKKVKLATIQIMTTATTIRLARRRAKPLTALPPGPGRLGCLALVHVPHGDPQAGLVVEQALVARWEVGPAAGVDELHVQVVPQLDDRELVVGCLGQLGHDSSLLGHRHLGQLEGQLAGIDGTHPRHLVGRGRVLPVALLGGGGCVGALVGQLPPLDHVAVVGPVEALVGR